MKMEVLLLSIFSKSLHRFSTNIKSYFLHDGDFTELTMPHLIGVLNKLASLPFDMAEWLPVEGILSAASYRSILSVGSAGSILSIGSAGSILSICSAGSILSIGGAGSILSFMSAGSVLSALSIRSRLSFLRHRSVRNTLAD